MDRNPQAEQMAHESMVRNLAAQAEAIWPQERALFDRYALRGPVRILDVGCGTGEITMRLAEIFPEADVLGVDVLEGPLSLARARAAKHGDRVRFERGDAFGLAFESDAFDLVVCRHMTQAVPRPELVLAELTRVCKRDGWLHVLSEDYAMLHFPHTPVDTDRLWRYGVAALARATDTDERVGRRTWSMMKALALVDLRVDYVVVDTLRVPRATFATIMRAWRDGYAEAIAARGQLPPDEVRPLFDRIIAAALDENEYAVWHVPIVGGRKP